ncbi:MoaD/ThiS family protein [Corynebacterium lubricantis]|uniref:MoaD/ThiS family protein n=1 Tax=Corynebacterium lubricantis TaxID=541095 RepID=UPI00037FC1F7|nr:MoaD/ThiS family protein [Corynebacterium lubricantis]
MEIHYFAAARASAGTATETLGGDFSTLSDVLDAAIRQHAEPVEGALPLAEVLDRCTYLLDGHRAERNAPVGGAQRIDVLPPFAGG